MQIQTAELNRSSYSPPVQLTSLASGIDQIYVAREDLLSGGTKQRACVPYLQSMHEQGISQFIYASPFSGFAQIALAASCRILGLECHLFCEKDQTATKTAFHEFSKIAAEMGAKIYLCDSLDEAESTALYFQSRLPRAFKIPLGFDHPLYKKFLLEEISICWKEICYELKTLPQNVWLPVGSGTLAKTFRKMLPDSVQLRCVNVHVLPATDERIIAVKNLPNTFVYSAPQKFPEPAEHLPEIPSNLYYDAKLWSFISRYASNGDLWWNVAR